MVRAAKLMLLFMQVSVQNIAAYRFDLVARVFMSFMHLGIEILGLWVVFSNVDVINGWGPWHMLILVGVYRIIAGGIRILIVPNMREVLEEIREGRFDFVLLRPVNAQLLASIRKFVVWRFSDVILGMAAAMVGAYKLLGYVPFGKVATFIVMLIASFVIVYCVWLMLATLCFWFVRIQNIEMVFWNVFEAGRFPIVIYRPSVQWLLTFVVPLAFITTFPAAAMAEDKALIPALSWLPCPLWVPAIILAGVMFVVSNRFWNYGIRHYSGASA